MATRDKAVEYIDHHTKNGVVKTLDIRLYAPDGSLFRMPHGGDPLVYIARGYKSKPDSIWQDLNDKHEKVKADSLVRSNFQREIKNREKELEAKKELIRFDELMQKQDADMIRVEAELAVREAKLDGTYVEPESVAVYAEDITVSEPVAVSAPAKKKPGRPKKQEA
jgi:hypothetical protein